MFLFSCDLDFAETMQQIAQDYKKWLVHTRELDDVVEMEFNFTEETAFELGGKIEDVLTDDNEELYGGWYKI